MNGSPSGIVYAKRAPSRLMPGVGGDDGSLELHLERRAPDDAGDQRREFVVIRGGVAHDAAHSGHVVVFQSAAERIRQKLFAHHSDEDIGAARESPAQFLRSIDAVTIEQSS